MNSLRNIAVLTLGILCLAAGTLSAQDADSAPAAQASRVVAVIPIHKDIDYGLLKSLERRIAEAREQGATVLIFEMDTYGGGLDAGHEIGDLINNLKAQTGGKILTVAYVEQKAISAGALISLACQQIVMRHGTTLGDCQAIMVSPQTREMVEAPEKIQSMVRALMRTYAKSNGYPEKLAEAMVDPDIEVSRVTFPDGRVQYMTPAEIAEIKEDQKQGIEQKLLVPKGKLLTMSDTEAADYGFSLRSVQGLNEAVELVAGAGARVTRYDTNWSEEMVRFLNGMAVSGLLMTVGLIALYMAFKTPGFGVPEVAAICCFAILFLSKYAVGLAGAMEAVLFVIGITLLAVEIFLIPGFGFVGIAGLACIVASLVLSLQKFVIPEYDFQFNTLIGNLLVVFGSLLAATLFFVLLVRFMPGTPGLRRLILTSTQTPTTGYVVSSAENRDLVGKRGVTLSTLRPSGRAEVEGNVIIVVSDGEFIDPGVPVVVADVRRNGVIVRRAEDI